MVTMTSILRQRAFLSNTRSRDSHWIQRSLRALATTAYSNANEIYPTSSKVSSHFRSTIQKNRLRASSHKNRSFHGSYTALKLSNPDAAAAKPTEEELAETEETVPEWQNPLHHNNPDMKKMFFDEDGADGLSPNPLPPFETDPDKVVAPPHIQDLADQVVNLTLLELKELTDKIAEHYGFDDEMMAASYGGGMVAAGAGPAGPTEEEVQEEKTIFDIKLIGFDAKAKIKVIKEIRAIAGLGLKEAKELVESAPKVVQKDLKQEKADEIKAQLEAVGAEVEIL